MAVWILIVALISFSSTSTQLNLCEKKETCSQCLSIDPNCFWCKQKDFERNRCDTKEGLSNNGCNLIEYFNESTQVVTDRELSHISVASESEAVQVKPQRVFLKLKPKSPRRLKLNYRQAVDYPVDLYYLMDLSRTMLDHKRKLAALGNKLATQMRRITKNFRLGFGSFVDKSILPFADTNPAKLKKPCPVCAPIYGFKNHMSLDTNTSRFSKEVEESSISGNIDGPEGGFDAIMQAIVCKKDIGWRKNARHVLIYASDATYHIAGDGKLGGLLEPNDGQCHLDSNGFYTHGNKQDYPSISQINLAAQVNNVHIIFAVFGPKIEVYRRLSQKIKSSSTARLTSNSSNIVELIKNEYHKLTSSIELADNRTEFIQIDYYSSCLKKNSEPKKTNICFGLQVDTQVEFDIKFEVAFCPNDQSKHNQTIKINPLGLREGLIIDVEVYCKCDCELDWIKETASPVCKNKGTYECGICSCDTGSFGKNCECDSSDLNWVQNDRRCFRNQNDTKPCSGRGNCMCNQCVCHSTRNEGKYSGQYCECEDYSCPFFEGQICGGETRGECKCGRCECSQYFKGPSCECPLSEETCVDPSTLMVCNENGICECGKCKCKEFYNGRYCDQCPTCLDRCSTFSESVRHQIDKDIEIITQSDNFTSYLVEEELIVNEDEKLCQFIDQDECVYSFKYGHRSSAYKSPIIIKALKTKTCKEQININVYILTYVISFLIIGLVTLILWRMITFCIDRHEYQKFIQSCETANWKTNENPLFKPSTSTFYNPIYPQSSEDLTIDHSDLTYKESHSF